jgi:hypothetical protein
VPTLDEIKDFIRKRGIDKQLDFLVGTHHLPDNWHVVILKGEEDRYKHVDLTYRFEGHDYRVTTYDWHSYYSPDGGGQAGTLTLSVDGEQVIKISIFDFGVNSQSLKALKAGAWIDDLPRLIDAVTEGEKFRMEQWRAEQDAETMKDIELGEYKLD